MSPATRTSRTARTPGNNQRGPYKPDETRRAIIDSALMLFERNGFHATSVQAVADAAKVTKGAFYHHFGSKEDLLRIIHDEFADYQLAEVQRIVDTVEGAAARVRELVRASVLSTARFRSHVAVYFQERRYLQGEGFAAVKEKRDAITDKMVAIIREGVADGTFRREADPTITMLGIIGMTAWSYQWLRVEGRLSPEQVADELADLVLDGLLKR